MRRRNGRGKGPVSGLVAQAQEGSVLAERLALRRRRQRRWLVVSPQKNRGDVSVSDRSRSRVSGGQSCLRPYGNEPTPIGPVIVCNEWTAGWGDREGERWVHPTNGRTGAGCFIPVGSGALQPKSLTGECIGNWVCL